MSDETAHQEVVTSLLDLQARLRGDGGEDTATKTAVHTDEPQDVVRVPDAGPVFVNLPEDDLTVAAEPDEERLLEVISDRGDSLAQVTPLHPASTLGADARLAALSERLSQLESELDGVIDRITKVDPARLDRLEAIHDELGVQQQHLKAAIDSHFTDLQRSIADRLESPED